MTVVEYAVILFHSTQSAIQAERVLLRAGLNVRLIPTPRQFSSNCGTALRLAVGDVVQAKVGLHAGGAEFDRVETETRQP